MRSISVGELRQNPTAMLAEVAAGESYSITRHHREVGRIIPAGTGAPLVPARRRTGFSVPALPADYRSPQSGDVDRLLDELRADS